MEEKIEKNIRIKSNNRCVICHNKQTNCYKLDKNKELQEDNFILLCDICAHKYLGNPDLEKQMKQKRDYWYKQIEEAKLYKRDMEKLLEPEEIRQDTLSDKATVIYHVVYENEGIEEATKDIYRLLWSAQERTPNQNRILYLDIDGHLNENGEFDLEMKELQQDFMLESLLPYFYEIHMPIIDAKNPEIQRNDIPKEFEFLSNKQETIEYFQSEIQGGAYMIEKIKKEYGKENKKFIYKKKFE